MKFNKSADSDFWYVAYDSDFHAGKIIILNDHVYFESRGFSTYTAIDLLQISNKIDDIEKQYGIDTTSTFTSNSL